MEHDTGGDPITGLKWSRRTTTKVAKALHEIGIEVGAKTVGRLLKELGFSLRVNHKRIESGNRNPPHPKERDRQFNYIGAMRESFARRCEPIISVDTKKKELVGNFKNGGRAWEKNAIAVYDHDFPSDAAGRVVPYGIYDTQANRGLVCLGSSAETPAFAVDSVVQWWKEQGQSRYPHATKLLILADCGGANSVRSRVWKYRIQNQLCDPYRLTVSVCHYPPGTSKWNPIEHRLFSEISKNWAGKPLVSVQTALGYIRTTHTSSGLRVLARFVTKKYEKGERVSTADMNSLRLSRPKTSPMWNYTLSPKM